MSHRFRFRFDPAKTMQAIAVLLRLESHAIMNYMRLLKVLYIAEREALRETGQPICGALIVAMERGPVMEEVYDLIRGRHLCTPEFSKHFVRSHYDLEMTEDPGIGKLSKFEIAKLQEVAARHVDHDEWDMVRICHELLEWKKNDPGNSSRAIPFSDVFDALGVMDHSQEIMEDERRHQEMLAAIEACCRDSARKRVSVESQP